MISGKMHQRKLSRQGFDCKPYMIWKDAIWILFLFSKATFWKSFNDQARSLRDLKLFYSFKDRLGYPAFCAFTPAPKHSANETQQHIFFVGPPK